jgi:gas vesicle protein
MSRRDTGSLVFLSGIVLGAVVGGAMGVLFAPATGEETRKKIAKKGKKAWKDVKEEAAELGEKLEPTVAEVKEKIGEKISEIQEGFDKGVKATSTKRKTATSRK